MWVTMPPARSGPGRRTSARIVSTAPSASPGEDALCCIFRLIDLVDRFRDQTEAFLASLQEGVEGDTEQDENHCLVHGLVTGGEGHPHGEQETCDRDGEVASEVPALDPPPAGHQIA